MNEIKWRKVYYSFYLLFIYKIILFIHKLRVLTIVKECLPILTLYCSSNVMLNKILIYLKKIKCWIMARKHMNFTSQNNIMSCLKYKTYLKGRFNSK